MSRLASREPAAFPATATHAVAFKAWAARARRGADLRRKADLVRRAAAYSLATASLERWKYLLAAVLMRRALLKRRAFRRLVRAAGHSATPAGAAALRLAKAFAGLQGMRRGLSAFASHTARARRARAALELADAHWQRRVASSAVRCWRGRVAQRRMDRELCNVADGHWFFRLSSAAFGAWARWASQAAEVRQRAALARRRRVLELWTRWREAASEQSRERRHLAVARDFARSAALAKAWAALAEHTDEQRLLRERR